MTKDIRVLLERFLKSLSFGWLKKNEAGKYGQIDYNSLRDLILVGLEKAGDSKDAIVVALGKEIGLTLASVLKVPLSQLVENKKLRITIELVSKTTASKKEKIKESKDKISKKKISPSKKTKNPRKSSSRSRTKQ